MRRGYRLLQTHWNSYYYQPRPERNLEIRKRLKELADQRRRLHVLLKREGHQVNHKRIERLYREEGLSLKRRKRKRISHIRFELPKVIRPNQYWTMDFVSNTLFYGRRIRVLAVIDLNTRKSLTIEVDHSLPGQRYCSDTGQVN